MIESTCAMTSIPLMPIIALLFITQTCSIQISVVRGVKE
jgi:hypothetical protein